MSSNFIAIELNTTDCFSFKINKGVESRHPQTMICLSYLIGQDPRLKPPVPKNSAPP